ncbi:hypothetical protein MIND_00797200 [Mycena indigotica]|uniref:Uncharacterized protein n=1 Tax=Mycena indigotica TaxID=2126181 RepID=A0A8H6W286_9AGAR|nr:uncharacterized protein MIND_00797200 [Mycena indigotica]KAF7302297.1 hypothetical protein MIND_00797200 [Mycena indigotica]
MLMELLPVDVLYIVLDNMLLDTTRNPDPRHEDCTRSCAIALSSTCRLLRFKTIPWLFSELYNWPQRAESLWPQSLWPHIAKLHIRDETVRNKARISISTSLAGATESMPSLTTVTLRLKTTIPNYLLISLSNCATLFTLSLHQACLDGDEWPQSLPFAALETLTIQYGGIWGVRRRRGSSYDPEREQRNIHQLLKAVSSHLMNLTLSGDFLSDNFPDIKWVALTSFVVTEHPPRPHIPADQLVSNMPHLRNLELLFTPNHVLADFPPFNIGGRTQALPSKLSSLSLSNVNEHDPIFSAIPDCITTLRLLAVTDLYHPKTRYSNAYSHRLLLDTRPLASPRAESALNHIHNLALLTSFSVALYDAPPMGSLIREIANKCPALRELEVRCLPLNTHMLLSMIDFKTDSELLLALGELRALTHLTWFVSTHSCAQNPGPPAHAAYKLFSALPQLQTVVYKFGNCYDVSLFSPVVNIWHRELLDGPEPARVVGELVNIPVSQGEYMQRLTELWRQNPIIDT